MDPVVRRGDALPLTEFLTFAHALADAAGEVIRPYFGAHGDVEAKGDDSPVTLADKLAEKEMRTLIEAAYPDHAIYGEEFGVQIASPAGEAMRLSEHSELSRSGEGIATVNSPSLTVPSPNPLPRGEGFSPELGPHYTWVLDPIDGTRAFIAGRKEWGTLIALCENGVPILGILDQPITGERWVGISGQPTRYSSAPANQPDHRMRSPEISIRTRPCASLADAELSTTSANYFTPMQAKQVVALAQQVRTTVKDGDCYAYGLLARGLRDVVIDAGLKPYDILALVPIIEGAGGKITGWNGEAVTLENYRDVVAVGDKNLSCALQIDTLP
jgi:myo-inositol-1(or 4)-monophosphatase